MVALACFASLVSGPALAQQKITIGIVGSLSDLTFYVAESKGYFSAEGITPDFVKFASATQMVAPLSTGQLDVASGSVSAALFNASARGIMVKLVADKGSMPPGYGFMPLMVRKDLLASGRVKTLADLKGMKIASSAKGGQADVALHNALKRVGLALQDVDAVYLGHAQIIAALQNGALDAGMTTEPDATIAEKLGGAVRFMTGDELYPNEQVAVLMYSAEFVRRSRELGVKFMRAYLRAARDYNDALVNGKISGPGAEALFQILIDKTDVKDREMLRTMTAYGLDPDGKLNVDGLRNDLATYRELGLIQGTPQIDDVVDMSFAAQAAQSLGPYQRKSKAESQ